MRVIAAFLCLWLSGCSAKDWNVRARGAVGIEDHYKGCATKMVFVPAEGLQKWVPNGFVVKEPGRAGVASFNCRYSEMEQGPVSFAMVAVMIEKPGKVFDPGLVDVYEVARITSESGTRMYIPSCISKSTPHR
jgi:hypothetical protein